MTGLQSLYSIAESQAGYFTTAQAADVDVSRRMLSHYATTGSLQRVRYGLYRIARFPPTRYEDIHQALLWVGGTSAASHTTALVVYGLSDAMPSKVHVTTVIPFTGTQQGVAIHHQSLDSDEIMQREGVRVTSPIRTISDVVTVDRQLAVQALEEALEQGIIRRSQIRDSANRYGDVAQLLESIKST
ncbi:MAG: hypothetical protein U9R51_04160 [Actinomycetota bacterium]|nr:hypothetical protein [Actinomycetota bacterium]